MCYIHHLCCEFHLLSLQMKHHLRLYDVQLNCHEKKSARKIGMYPYGGRSLDVVHDFEFDKESVYFIINIILAMFFLSKKKPYDPKFTKSNILITAHWKQQSKTRDHLCFICKLWSLNISLETPVEKYVHFQAFTSCLIL